MLQLTTIRHLQPSVSRNLPMISFDLVGDLLTLCLSVRDHHSWIFLPQKLSFLRAMSPSPAIATSTCVVFYVRDFNTMPNFYVFSTVMEFNKESLLCIVIKFT